MAALGVFLAISELAMVNNEKLSGVSSEILHLGASMKVLSRQCVAAQEILRSSESSEIVIVALFQK